jgi:hypothetical protein
MKKCTKCGIEKDESCFGKNKSRKSGLQEQCKDCRKLKQVEYYQKNKETIKIKVAEYRQENKETIAEYQAEYKQKNKKSIALKKSEYQQNNKETIKKNQARWYQENKEIILIERKEYRQKQNKEEVAIYQSEYQEKNKKVISIKKLEYERERRKNDPALRLRRNISRSVNNMLKINGSSKMGKSIIDNLPYTKEELCKYIESLFSHPDNLTPDGKVWMTWENQGAYIKTKWNDNDPSTWKWQLDHIIPHSTFKYKSMDCKSFQDCWALDNLRPLSAKQNHSDGVNRTRHMN